MPFGQGKYGCAVRDPNPEPADKSRARSVSKRSEAVWCFG
jgi:hypothetical protein